jgi:hypothetical protein
MSNHKSHHDFGDDDPSLPGTPIKAWLDGRKGSLGKIEKVPQHPGSVHAGPAHYRRIKDNMLLWVLNTSTLDESDVKVTTVSDAAGSNLTVQSIDLSNPTKYEHLTEG